MNAHEDLLAFLTANGYTHLRVLEDGTVCGLGKLLFTTGLHIGLNEQMWERRYCFEDPAKALAELQRLENEDSIPEGWIAQRNNFGTPA